MKDVDSSPINLGSRRVRLTRLTLYDARPSRSTSGPPAELDLLSPSRDLTKDDTRFGTTESPHELPQGTSCSPASYSLPQGSSTAFRRSSMAPNDILPVIHRASTPSMMREGSSNNTLEEIVSKRKTHKCRGRSDSMAWFELRSMCRLSEGPPLTEMKGLSNADLFVNWIDTDSLICQIWKFVAAHTPSNGAPISHWVQMEWGAPSQDGGHRLIVTEKGQPSFVAESTWRNKYRLQTAKIIL